VSNVFEWRRVPDDFSLYEQKNWDRQGNRFRAARKLFLVVKNRSTSTFDGPVLFDRTLPKDADIKIERKQSIVRKNTIQIGSSLQTAISTKLASEVSSKVGADLGLIPLLSKAKISGELATKISGEFTAELTKQVTGTSAYEVTSADEITSSMSLKTAGQDGAVHKYHFFLPVWRHTWDIYLYSQETFELTYRRNMLLQKVRDSFKHETWDLRLPLARITFYEPQDDLPSFHPAPYKPDVADASTITIDRLTDPMPNAAPASQMGFTEIASLAFPVTKDERKKSLDGKKVALCRDDWIQGPGKLAPTHRSKATTKYAKRKTAGGAISKRKAPAASKRSARLGSPSRARGTRGLSRGGSHGASRR
jgi:hypothetical protein